MADVTHLKITRATGQRIADLRERGWSISRISRRVDVPAGTISWYCLREGIESPATEKKVLPRRSAGPVIMARGNHLVRRFTAEEDAVLLEMAVRGVSRTEISRCLERPHNSIRGRLMTLARNDARREANTGDSC